MATIASPPLQLARSPPPAGAGCLSIGAGTGGGVSAGRARGRARRHPRVAARSVASDRGMQGLVSPEEGLPKSVLNSIDSSAIASNIKHHAEFTALFSPEHFSPLKAYHATAKSVLDALLINWNVTYDYYNKVNAKQAYYLSMEFLQGVLWTRMSILNTAGSAEFSSDRTIHEYAKDIWDIKPVILP